jgi:hypothetical protein
LGRRPGLQAGGCIHSALSERADGRPAEHADRGTGQVITLVRHPARQDTTQTETIMKFHPSIARQAAPSAAKAATIVTWVYAACFGLPAIPVAVYLLRNGRLPWLFDAFPMYGGPWYHSGQPERFAAQLDAFLVLMLVVSWGGWLLWRGSQSRSGARPRHDSRGGTVLVRLRTAHPAPARAGPRRAPDRRVAAVAPFESPR